MLDNPHKKFNFIFDTDIVKESVTILMPVVKLLIQLLMAYSVYGAQLISPFDPVNASL